MNIITTSESLNLVASLGDLVTFLLPVKAIVLQIVQGVEQADDNTNQSFYLLKRSINLCNYINGQYKAGKCDQAHDHLDDLKHTLDKIHLCIQHLSRKTPLQRFLQRQEISESIKNAHQCIDWCIELFQLQSVVSLRFTIADHEAARQKDQAQLANTLEQLLKNDANILETLELRNDQLMEAVRGLRDNLQRGIDDAVQRRFATASLRTLLERQAESSSSELTPYEWALSSLEILVEGEILGAGAFGTVYSGRWNGTKVAVKQLSKGTPKKLLIKEIEIWRRMQHPHIASFFRACLDSNPPLLVAELYNFGNAMSYLEEYPEANRVLLCHEITLGMVFLHKHKIIHGDLKPANVLIDNGHRARITDFGLSKIKSSLTTQTIADVTQNSARSAPGTKVFMAPERLRRGTMSYATDVYAFAMSAYQIFTGEAPFQHLPEEEIRQVVVVDQERPDRPEDEDIAVRGLDDRMWNLLGRCWADNRTSRPSFQEVSGIIGAWLGPQATPRKSTSNVGLANGRVAGNLSITTTTPESKPIVPNANIDSGEAIRIPGTGVMVGASDFEVIQSRTSELLDQSALQLLGSTIESTLATPSTSSQVGDEASDYFSVFKAIDEYTPPALDDFSPAIPSSVPSSSGLDTTSTAMRRKNKSNSRPSSWFLRLLSNKGGEQARGRSDSPTTMELRAPRPSGGEDLNMDDVGQPPSKARGKKKAESAMYRPELDYQIIKSSRPKEHRAKFVIVGDGACGKTSLLTAFCTNRFPSEYNPTVFDNYAVEISIVQQKVVLSLFDTAGQEEYERLRPLSYPNADVFLICFCITTPDSLSNVAYKWIEEVRHHCPEVPVMLVGCKSDLRADEGTQKPRIFVTTQEANDVAREIKAACYLECSALTGDGVRELFRTATTCALGNMLREQENKSKEKSCVVA